MLYLWTLLTTARRDERGASAVEYGLLIAGVVAALIFALQGMGDLLHGEFERQNTGVSP